MRAELLQLAAELARAGTPFVMATVVWRQAPSSAQRGDGAIVTADGTFHGWLGGACTQPTVVAEAHAALADGKPRVLALSPEPQAVARPGVAVFPMTCHSGGSVEIYLEPVLPAQRLVVFGLTPAARTLARLGRDVGWAVTVVDREGGGEGVGDLGGIEVRPASAAGDLGGSPERPPFAVVACMGDGDEEAIEAALALRPAYLGVVASRRRFAVLRSTLLARGGDEAALAAIRSPAGLDLGARLPEEIAVSILAEMVQVRRGAEEATAGEPAHAGHDAPASATASTASGAPRAAAAGGLVGIGSGAASRPVAVTPPHSPATGAPAASETAIDPICGMTVRVAGARHVAEHGGQAYYFCCAGCRERFLADPIASLQARSTTG